MTEKVEFLLKIGAAGLSLVTVSVSVWAGYQAYANYRQQVVLQATRELHGEQRKICIDW
ncbi:hypothetical protein [Variovorax boronicumulans]|uniref:hypothetical protein n=1 Tax=Variovorax boronicumulans TaxID=436515 RepID=UPI0027D78971|nr:hypothetical protein [Variovorax boronicumulans]